MEEKMNLLKEIVEANKKAREKNENYLSPLNGFSGRGSDEVWEQMSAEAKATWSKQNWPKAILTMPAKDLVHWAEQFSLDITDM